MLDLQAVTKWLRFLYVDVEDEKEKRAALLMPPIKPQYEVSSSECFRCQLALAEVQQSLILSLV